MSLQTSLAAAYMDADRTEAGIAMLNRTLALSRKSMGDKNPQTLITMYYLCGNLAKVGKLEEAATLLKENLASAEPLESAE